ncbi:MAG: hypothetical protein Q4C96_06740 [Planctomycetia bacterium]|nr:hypothetical protein [Planctomycetia bacterium]
MMREMPFCTGVPFKSSFYVVQTDIFHEAKIPEKRKFIVRRV